MLLLRIFKIWIKEEPMQHRKVTVSPLCPFFDREFTNTLLLQKILIFYIRLGYVLDYHLWATHTTTADKHHSNFDLVMSVLDLQ